MAKTKVSLKQQIKNLQADVEYYKNKSEQNMEKYTDALEMVGKFENIVKRFQEMIEMRELPVRSERDYLRSLVEGMVLDPEVLAMKYKNCEHRAPCAECINHRTYEPR